MKAINVDTLKPLIQLGGVLQVEVLELVQVYLPSLQILNVRIIQQRISLEFPNVQFERWLEVLGCDGMRLNGRLIVEGEEICWFVRLRV